MHLAFRALRSLRLPEHGRVLPEEDGDAVEAGADPDELPGRAELVELRRRIVGNPPRQHLGLPERDRQGQPLKRDERLAQARAPVDSVPAREEAGEGDLLDGLDLLAKGSERGSTDPPEDVGVAPLALGSARPELAADEPVLALQHDQLGFGALDVDAEPLSRLTGRERAAAARIARKQRAQRFLRALEERIGQPARRHRAERVAVPAGILGGDQPLLAGDPHAHSPPLRLENRAERLVELARPQVAASQEQVVQPVRILRLTRQRGLDLVERAGIEQVAQLFLAEQLAEEVAVERQRLRPPLGGRRVVLVHVRRDVVEEERGRIRRGRRSRRPRRRSAGS